MENITDLSFNDDEDVPARNDEVIPAAKPSAAAQPMVVVQYRTRGVPWWLLSLLTVFAPVCTILIYHSLFVGKYRAQAVETAEALRMKLAGVPPAEVKKPPEASLPLALNSQPIATPAAPAPTAASTVPSSAAAAANRDQGGGVASAVPAVGPPKPGTGLVSGEAAQAQKAAGTPAPGGNRSVSAVSVDVPAATTQGPAAGSGRLSSPTGGSAVAAKAADGPAAGPKPSGDPKPPNPSPTATVAMKFSERNKDRQPALDRSPFDEPSDNPEPSKPARPGDTDPARPAGAPAPALAARTNPAAQPRGAGVPAAQQPLPSKEETMRQIEEEAANNQAKVQQMEEREAADLRSFRYQERVKFRDELRAVLQEHGNQAGPEINQLAKRYSFDKDPERLIQATRVWRQARASQAAKVKTIRALELPEALILDFLSDDFHAKVRTPGGPRNENEVRVRAANRLLQLELPPEDAMPLSRPPADPLPARTPRSRASAFPGGQVQRGR